MKVHLKINKNKSNLAGGFPCGPVAKNLPVHAGDTGSSPGQEDPTCRGIAEPVLHSCWASALSRVLKLQLSPRAATTETHTPRACALPQEKPPQWEARAPQPEGSSCSLNLGKTHAAMKTQRGQK